MDIISACRVTFSNKDVRKFSREGIPLERLMIETDAPCMGFNGNKDSFFDAEGASFASLPSKKRKRLKSQYPNVPSSLHLVLKQVQTSESRAERETRGDDFV